MLKLNIAEKIWMNFVYNLYENSLTSNKIYKHQIKTALN